MKCSLSILLKTKTNYILWLVILIPQVVLSTTYERVGIFIGCDYGLNNEKPLSYASRDARLMSQVMQKNGGISKDRCYLLVNAPLEEITDAFQEIAGRLKEIDRAGKQTSLFFYYSGHGSADALHIRNKKLVKSEFRRALESLESDLKIAIIDACESGDFLRRKGARIIDHHTVDMEDSLENRGTMVISSSSRGEMAQESEEYRGAVFTYHLINGIRGPADYNGDGRVALMEAFHYAGASTRMEHTRGNSFTQSPSYDFDVVGKSDIVMADLRESRSKLALHDIPARVIEIYDELSPELTARVYLAGKDSTYCHLPSRKYIVKYTHREKTFIRRVDLTWGKSASISGTDFSARPNLILYAKGAQRSFDLVFHGIQASARRSQAFSDQAHMYYLLGYVYRNSLVKQELTVGFTELSMAGKDVPLVNEIRAMRLSYGCKVSFFRFVHGQFLTGGELSYLRVHQTVHDLRLQGSPLYVDNGELKDKSEYRANVFQAFIPVEVEIFLPFATWLSVWVNPGMQRYRDSARSSARYEMLFEQGISLGYQF